MVHTKYQWKFFSLRHSHFTLTNNEIELLQWKHCNSYFSNTNNDAARCNWTISKRIVEWYSMLVRVVTINICEKYCTMVISYGLPLNQTEILSEWYNIERSLYFPPQFFTWNCVGGEAPKPTQFHEAIERKHKLLFNRDIKLPIDSAFLQPCEFKF